MAHHGHGHGCSGDRDHDETPELGLQYTLYTKIDLEHVQCLNEVVEDSSKHVFKPWDERLNTEKFVESDADEELLFNIPFTGNVKLKGVIVIGGEDESHPNKMRLPHMTFDDTRIQADQEFDMHRDNKGILEYPTKIVTFSSIHALSIHFPSNFGSDSTKIYYIGLKGEFLENLPRYLVLQMQNITIVTIEEILDY